MDVTLLLQFIGHSSLIQLWIECSDVGWRGNISDIFCRPATMFRITSGKEALVCLNDSNSSDVRASTESCSGITEVSFQGNRLFSPRWLPKRGGIPSKKQVNQKQKTSSCLAGCMPNNILFSIGPRWIHLEPNHSPGVCDTFWMVPGEGSFQSRALGISSVWGHGK